MKDEMPPDILLLMARCFSDFVVVVRPATVCSEAVLFALSEYKVIAMHELSYSGWLNGNPAPEHNLLYFRQNGEVLYAKNAAEISEIRREVEALC